MFQCFINPVCLCVFVCQFSITLLTDNYCFSVCNMRSSSNSKSSNSSSSSSCSSSSTNEDDDNDNKHSLSLSLSLSLSPSPPSPHFLSWCGGGSINTTTHALVQPHLFTWLIKRTYGIIKAPYT